MPVTSVGKQGDAINPTVGVRMRGNQPDSKGLVFQKDPSRPGGGIFVAVDADYSDLPTTVVTSAKNQSAEGNQGQDQGQIDAEHNKQQQQQSQQPQQQQSQQQQQPASGSAASIVNYTPLPTTPLNLNPRMNVPSLAGDGQRQVQLMNVLDSTMGISSSRVNQIANPEQLIADTGLVDGLPAGSMFDWEQWETFFSRFGMASGMGAENAAGTLQAFASHAAAQAQAGAATLAGIGRNRPINIAPQPSNDQRSLDSLKGK